MTIGGGRDLVHRYFKLLSGDPEADPDDFLAEGFVFHHPPLTPTEGVSGRATFLGDVLAPTRRAFPDMSFTIADVVVEHDRACARWAMAATHHETYMGVAATGRHVSVSGMNFFRFQARQIAETWVQRDNLGLLRQLGA